MIGQCHVVVVISPIDQCAFVDEQSRMYTGMQRLGGMSRPLEQCTEESEIFEKIGFTRLAAVPYGQQMRRLRPAGDHRLVSLFGSV